VLLGSLVESGQLTPKYNHTLNVSVEKTGDGAKIIAGLKGSKFLF